MQVLKGLRSSTALRRNVNLSIILRKLSPKGEHSSDGVYPLCCHPSLLPILIYIRRATMSPGVFMSVRFSLYFRRSYRSFWGGGFVVRTDFWFCSSDGWGIYLSVDLWHRLCSLLCALLFQKSGKPKPTSFPPLVRFPFFL